MVRQPLCCDVDALGKYGTDFTGHLFFLTTSPGSLDRHTEHESNPTKQAIQR